MAQTNQPPISEDPIQAAWELEITTNTNENDSRVDALERTIQELERRIRALETA